MWWPRVHDVDEVFYAQVRNSRDHGMVEAFSTVSSSEQASYGDLHLSNNSANATLLVPETWTAIRTFHQLCQAITC